MITLHITNYTIEIICLFLHPKPYTNVIHIYKPIAYL